MSNRPIVQPNWLDHMLIVWGRTLPGVNTWYKITPYLKHGIPTKTRDYDANEFTPSDYDELAKAIENLDHKYQCALRMAYKPWTRKAMLEELAQYGVGDRTHRRWLHDAAAILAAAIAPNK